MTNPEARGRQLASRHQSDPSPEPDPDASLLNFAESARLADWSFRSALVRLAQAEPTRAGATLELIRRCDGALRPLRRALERHTAGADVRVADLARLCHGDASSCEPLMDGYDAGLGESGGTPLVDEERAAVPLLIPVLELDGLADTLAQWAAAGPNDPPVDEVDAIGRSVFEQLEQLSVPRETRETRQTRQ